MGKEIMVFIYKVEWTPDTQNSMNESKWKVPGMIDYLLYDFSCMKY